MNVYVNFFLRGKQTAAKEKSCAIYAEIHVEDTRATAFSTKLKVPPKYWRVSKNKQGIKSSSDELPVSRSYHAADMINDHLTTLRQLIYQAARDLELSFSSISAERVKLQLLSPKPIIQRQKFIDVVDMLRSFLEQKRKSSTMLTYRTRRNNIEQFLRECNYESLLIQDFTFQHFEDIQLWMLRQKDGRNKTRWGINTINKHLTMVNKALNYGVNKGFIQANPIGEMGLEYEDTKPPQYLLPDDRLRILENDMKSLEKERDVAVFLMHTGLSYTDYLSLTDDHMLRLPTGEPFIKKPRDKSEVYSIIPLMEQAHRLIAKYGSINNLPRPDISDLNKALKPLGEAAKSPFSLSTSTFRETFSSMMENEYMVPDRLLMFMMGHTNPRQLRNYSRVMPARILHELKKHDVIIPFNLQAFESLVKAS